MNIVIFGVLAALAGLTWRWTTHNEPMPYWVMVAAVTCALLASDLAERAWERRHARRTPARRRAHARPNPTKTERTDA